MGQVQRVAPPGAVTKANSFKDWMEGEVAARLAAVATKHLPADRLVRVALAAWNQNPRLRKCKQDTFLLSLLRAASLGLDPSGTLGQAYLVPYGDTCNLIIGYRGLIALARRSGEIETIEAHSVCENDGFEYRLGLNPVLEHEPCRVGDRGEVIAAYAIARFKGGGYQIEVMFRNDIDAIMLKTQGRGKSGPWRDHYSEMARKTAVRRLSKFLPLNAELATAIEYDSEVEFRAPFIDISPDEPDEPDAPASNGGALPGEARSPRQVLLSAISVSQEAEPESYKRVVGRKNPFAASEDQLRGWITEIQSGVVEVVDVEASPAPVPEPVPAPVPEPAPEEDGEREKLVESIRHDLAEHPGLVDHVGLSGKRASELSVEELVAVTEQIDKLLVDAWEEKHDVAPEEAAT